MKSAKYNPKQKHDLKRDGTAERRWFAAIALLVVLLIVVLQDRFESDPKQHVEKIRKMLPDTKFPNVSQASSIFSFNLPNISQHINIPTFKRQRIPQLSNVYNISSNMTTEYSDNSTEIEISADPDGSSEEDVSVITSERPQLSDVQNADDTPVVTSADNETPAEIDISADPDGSSEEEESGISSKRPQLSDVQNADVVTSADNETPAEIDISADPDVSSEEEVQTAWQYDDIVDLGDLDLERGSYDGLQNIPTDLREKFGITSTPQLEAPKPGRQVVQRHPNGLGYLLYLPKSHNLAGPSWPLLVYLHGAKEMGPPDDPRIIISLASSGTVLHHPEAMGDRFIVVSPHATKGWNLKSLQNKIVQLIDTLTSTSDLHINPDRVYLTGTGSGGYGAWSLLVNKPNMWAAVVPVSGYGSNAIEEKMSAMSNSQKTAPVWVFHGANDAVVPVQASDELVNLAKEAGLDVKYTRYERSPPPVGRASEVGHASWIQAYQEEPLWDWLLEQRIGGPVTEEMSNYEAKPRRNMDGAKVKTRAANEDATGMADYAEAPNAEATDAEAPYAEAPMADATGEAVYAEQATTKATNAEAAVAEAAPADVTGDADYAEVAIAKAADAEATDTEATDEGGVVGAGVGGGGSDGGGPGGFVGSGGRDRGGRGRGGRARGRRGGGGAGHSGGVGAGDRGGGGFGGFGGGGV